MGANNHFRACGPILLAITCLTLLVQAALGQVSYFNANEWGDDEFSMEPGDYLAFAQNGVVVEGVIDENRYLHLNTGDVIPMLPQDHSGRWFFQQIDIITGAVRLTLDDTYTIDDWLAPKPQLMGLGVAGTIEAFVPLNTTTNVVEQGTVQINGTATIDDSHLAWTGDSTGVWDVNNGQDWDNGTPTIDGDILITLDSVTFAETDGKVVGITNTAPPGALTINNTGGNDYTFNGTVFGGSGSVTKGGTGTATFQNADITTAGDLDVSGGILVLNTDASTMSINTVGAGATLDVGVTANGTDLNILPRDGEVLASETINVASGVHATYTGGGDFNPDGQVSLLDLNALGPGFGQNSSWQDGDVTLLDLNALGVTFGDPVSASVPEPVSLTLLALGGAAILRRRV